MSGKHQRRMWVLPIPTGNTSRYDRMHIGVGRANSTSVISDYDTLLKSLTSYLFEQDTFIKVLTNIITDFDTLGKISTNISSDIDTLIKVSVIFNYTVDQDTLIKILTNLDNNHDTLIKVTGIVPPVPDSYGGSSGRILNAPIGPYKKKKKKADEIIKLEKLNVSKLAAKKQIQIRIEALFDIKLIIGDAVLITDNDILNSTILNVDFIDASDTRPIEVKVFKEEKFNDYS